VVVPAHTQKSQAFDGSEQQRDEHTVRTGRDRGKYKENLTPTSSSIVIWGMW
jgi:hypothetical protein